MSAATHPSAFRFDRDYKNHDQVAPYFPAYMARYEELTAAGQYPYNSSFEGHIPGIEGPDEETAIYLLQGMRKLRELDEKISAAKSNGYEEFDHDQVTDEPQRFAAVIRYGFYVGGTGWEEWRPDVRLVKRNGSTMLIQKRRRNGCYLHGRLLVKR